MKDGGFWIKELKGGLVWRFQPRTATHCLRRAPTAGGEAEGGPGMPEMGTETPFRKFGSVGGHAPGLCRTG